MLPTPYDTSTLTGINSVQCDVIESLVSNPTIAGGSSRPERGLGVVPARLHNQGARVLMLTAATSGFDKCRRGIAAGDPGAGTSVSINPTGTITLNSADGHQLTLDHRLWSNVTLEAWLWHGREVAAELVDNDLTRSALDFCPEPLSAGWPALTTADLEPLAGARAVVTREPGSEGTETLSVEITPPAPLGTAHSLRINHTLTSQEWSAEYDVETLDDHRAVTQRCWGHNDLLDTGHHFSPLSGDPAIYGVSDDDAPSLRACSRVYRAALEYVADHNAHRPTTARGSNAALTGSAMAGILAGAGGGIDTRTLFFRQGGTVSEEH